MNRPTSNPRVCAIIVTFEPKLEILAACIARIESQVERVCLVDNSNNPLTQQAIKCRWPNLTYLGQGSNQGIARAHNVGINWAASLEFDYLLLLDQDSLANPDLIARQLLAFKTLHQQNCMPAAIGASYVESLSQQRSAFLQIRWPRCKRVFYEPSAYNLVAADNLISSGSLFHLPTLQLIGPMDESLFIDHVDTDWFLRAKFNGYQAYGIWDATMSHTLGSHTKRLWFGRWYRYPVYPPTRYYYIFRNSLSLRRKPWASFAWRAFDARRLVRIAILNVLLGTDRRAILRCTLAGIRDGICGRSGPQPTPISRSPRRWPSTLGSIYLGLRQSSRPSLALLPCDDDHSPQACQTNESPCRVPSMPAQDLKTSIAAIHPLPTRHWRLRDRAAE